jgi:hypothetical protein
MIVSTIADEPTGNVVLPRRYYIHYILPQGSSLKIVRNQHADLVDLVDEEGSDDNFECCPNKTPKWIRIAPKRLRPILCGWRLLIKVIGNGEHCTCLACPDSDRGRRECTEYTLPWAIQPTRRSRRGYTIYMTGGTITYGGIQFGPGVGFVPTETYHDDEVCLLSDDNCTEVVRGIQGSYQVVITSWYKAALFRRQHICY